MFRRITTLIVASSCLLAATACDPSPPDPSVPPPQMVVLQDNQHFRTLDSNTLVIELPGLFELRGLLNHDACDKYDLPDPGPGPYAVRLAHAQCFQVLMRDHVRLVPAERNGFFQAFVGDSADRLANSVKAAVADECLFLQRTEATDGVPVVDLHTCILPGE